MANKTMHFTINPSPDELFQIIFIHLKLELLTQFPPSNDKNISIFEK